MRRMIIYFYIVECGKVIHTKKKFWFGNISSYVTQIYSLLSNNGHN